MSTWKMSYDAIGYINYVLYDGALRTMMPIYVCIIMFMLHIHFRQSGRPRASIFPFRLSNFLQALGAQQRVSSALS